MTSVSQRSSSPLLQPQPSPALPTIKPVFKQLSASKNTHHVTQDTHSLYTSPQSYRKLSSEDIPPVPEPVKKLVMFRSKQIKPKRCGDAVALAFTRFFARSEQFLREKFIIVFSALFALIQILAFPVVMMFRAATILMGRQLVGSINKMAPLLGRKRFLKKQGSFKKAHIYTDRHYSNKLTVQRLQMREKRLLTLVLDLDETLIHTTRVPPNHGTYETLDIIKTNGECTEVYIKKRPYLDEFLEQLAKEFNLVIFTASRMEYADTVIDFIDPHYLVAKRFYRESCIKTATGWIKDLSKVESDLNRVILLDNSDIAGSLQPGNYIPIKSWFHDDTDRSLLRYMDFLVGCAKKWKVDTAKVKDIRGHLQEFFNPGRKDSQVSQS